MRRASALLVGFVVALLAGEGAARALWDEAAWRYDLTPRQVSDVELHRLSEDEALLYELRPGVTATLDGPFGDRDISINDHGFRGPAPRESAFRIVALGGSNTFGAAVSDGETWPAALERELADVQVLNLGVCGYMTRQKVALAERLLPELEPDLVLIQVYNQGRRFVLEGTLDEAFARWPALYGEFFVGGQLLPSRSALLRLGVLGANRVAHDRAVWSRTERANAEDARAMQALVEASPVPVVVVFPPAGGPDSALRGLDVTVLDLSQADNPFGAEGLEIHPPAPVYAWYGEVLAGWLADRKLIDP